MVSTRLGKECSTDLSEKKFRVVFDFLKRDDLAELPLGWIELEEGVMVLDVMKRLREAQ